MFFHKMYNKSYINVVYLVSEVPFLASSAALPLVVGTALTAAAAWLTLAAVLLRVVVTSSESGISFPSSSIMKDFPPR